MIMSAHITLFFRTVVNIFINDQIFSQNLNIPPFYIEKTKKRTIFCMICGVFKGNIDNK